MSGNEFETPILRDLIDVETKPLRWLWPGRVPLGKLSLLDGDPGLGKSLVTLDLAARVSTGRAMPDGQPSDLSGPAGVVLLSAEDDPADTIRPRLDATGADCSLISLLERVQIVDEKGNIKMRLPSLADIDSIRKAIARKGAALVIVDPLMAYIFGDSHKDQEVRQCLAPLAELAAATGVAVLVVRHLNKSPGSNALHRGGGSIGIIGAARSAMVVAKDPDDETGERRIVAVSKGNLAAPAPSLVYRVGVVDEIARVDWCGTSEHSASTILAVPVSDEDRGAVKEAVDFLREALASGPVHAKEILSHANAAGISKPSLDRAKKQLCIKSTKLPFSGKWEWDFPPKQHDQSTPSQNHDHVDHLDRVGAPLDEERAAILEFDGGLSKSEAEKLAGGVRRG